MKRRGELFQHIVSLDNLHEAYCKARRGKRWQNVVKEFERDVDGNLKRLQNALVSKSFRTAPYRTKIIREPKERIIFILPFYPDRIVQHALIQQVGPIWDGLFIYDSYACRVGKGIHRGSTRTMELLRKNSHVLKADISKFYPSIDHDVLYKIIQRKIKCSDTLWLLRDIIYSCGTGKNVPIGNYTSQWFGNLYLNELDQWLKHKRKIKYYVRYCDDFLLFHDDKRFLHQMKNEIVSFIGERLRLTFSRWSIFPVTQGIDFLGYRHFRDHILLRKSTVKRVRRRLQKLPQLLREGTINLEQFRSSIASTKGWMQWADTYNLSVSLRLAELEKMCEALQ